MATLTCEEILADHPFLKRIFERQTYNGIMPHTTFKWELDPKSVVTFHDLSNRWLVRMTSSEVPRFSWSMDIKTLLYHNHIFHVDSETWNAFLQNTLRRENSLPSHAAQLCANLAVRALPGYPASIQLKKKTRSVKNRCATVLKSAPFEHVNNRN